MHRKNIKAYRGTVLGLAVAVVGVWGGLGLASATPSAIVTCTNRRTGHMLLSKSGTCNARGQVATLWDDHAVAQAQIDAARLERDSANALAVTRTAERDAANALVSDLQNQLEALTKSGDGALQFARLVAYAYCQDSGPAGFCPQPNDASYAVAPPGTSLANFHLDDLHAAHANLAGALATDATFRRADLSGADLSGVAGDRPNFDTANLSGANLAGMRGDTNNFDNANLSDSNVSGVTFVHASFQNADLSRANVSHASLQFSWFGDVHVANTDMSYSYIANSSFRPLTPGTETLLNGVNFAHAVLNSSDLTAVAAIGTDFTSADLGGVTSEVLYLGDNSFWNANLGGAVLPNVRTVGTVDFRNTTCPDGSNSRSHPLLDGGQTCFGFGMTHYVFSAAAGGWVLASEVGEI